MIFDDQHQLFRQSLRDFIQREAMPHIDVWEKAGQIPREIWLKLGEQGFLGICVPEEYGGAGLDPLYMAVMAEELSKTCSGGFTAAIMSHISLAQVYVERFANAELKGRYLPKGCTGEFFSALAITEPNTGSDVAAIQTTAKKEGDFYTVKGSKIFITNGVLSDYLVVAVKTDPDAGYSGISLLVVDRESEGLSARMLDKLGWRASDTGEIWFDQVRVPAENLIGEEGSGFFYIMQNFALERLILAIGAIAACEEAIRLTLQYMSERSAFGRPINKFQVLRHRIAQLVSETERAKIFNYTVLRQMLGEEMPVKECAMAKLLATELSDKVMTECLQCYGGYGFMEDYPLARLFRDSRLGTIGGGTSEIMRELIAKFVFG